MEANTIYNKIVAEYLIMQDLESIFSIFKIDHWFDFIISAENTTLHKYNTKWQRYI